MPYATKLSKPVVIEAIVAEKLKYDIDDDGDFRLIIPRVKGKDLTVYIFGGAANNGILSLSCHVARWFSRDQLPELLYYCNEWNKNRRLPSAFVFGPDSGGDLHARLDYSIVCDSGIHVELIQETIIGFCTMSIRFWDDLDAEI